MNSITNLAIENWKFANRSIETILLTSKELKINLLYVFNFEGKSFKVFTSSNDLYYYLFENKDSNLIEFDNEVSLDNYLLNYEITYPK